MPFDEGTFPLDSCSGWIPALPTPRPVLVWTTTSAVESSAIPWPLPFRRSLSAMVIVVHGSDPDPFPGVVQNPVAEDGTGGIGMLEGHPAVVTMERVFDDHRPIAGVRAASRIDCDPRPLGWTMRLWSIRFCQVSDPSPIPPPWLRATKLSRITLSNVLAI